MGITGNRGEWSEVYAFLRLLADGKLFSADENLDRIEDMFFPNCCFGFIHIFFRVVWI